MFCVCLDPVMGREKQEHSIHENQSIGDKNADEPQQLSSTCCRCLHLSSAIHFYLQLVDLGGQDEVGFG